jgi:hypothetical protein
MSLRTFTENVIALAIENCLICDIDKILSPREVEQMDEAQLKQLAAESDDVSTFREELEHQVRDLRAGLQMCQKYKERKATRMLTPLRRQESKDTDSLFIVLPTSLSRSSSGPLSTQSVSRARSGE